MKLNPSSLPAKRDFITKWFHPTLVGFIPSARTDLVEKSQVEIRLGFFLSTLLQNRSAEQVFSKSIRGFRSVGRLIPWRWWELHVTAIFRGGAPCAQTDLCIIIFYWAPYNPSTTLIIKQKLHNNMSFLTRLYLNFTFLHRRIRKKIINNDGCSIDIKSSFPE